MKHKQLYINFPEVGGVLPYPYIVDRDGLVGRQDFWKGEPYQIVGFCKRPKAGEVHLTFKDFLKAPNRAVGMFVVWRTPGDAWYTKTDMPIESVTAPNVSSRTAHELPPKS